MAFNRLLTFAGLSFPMSTGESSEIYSITRVSGMLGLAAWAIWSPISEAIISLSLSLGRWQRQKTTKIKSLGSTQLASEALGTGLSSCQGGHPKRLTAHMDRFLPSCLGLCLTPPSSPPAQLEPGPPRQEVGCNRLTSWGLGEGPGSWPRC